MKRRILAITTTLAAAIWLSVPAMAQHGHGGGGIGEAGGMGQSTDRGSMGRGGENMGMGSRGQMRGPNANEPTMSTHGKSVDQLLTQNTKLSSRLQSLLPTGTNLQTAASGFKNLGQFVAAAEVSHNLGLSFDDLKAKMTSGDSLGKAIHALDANVNAKKEAKKANRQAKELISESRQRS